MKIKTCETGFISFWPFVQELQAKTPRTLRKNSLIHLHVRWYLTYKATRVTETLSNCVTCHVLWSDTLKLVTKLDMV